jgi:hypothetical protein
MVKETGVKNIPDYISRKTKQWKDVHINIAIVGETYVGKSPFKEHTFKSDILFANNNILLGVILDHVLGKMTRKSANVNNIIST